MPSFDKNRIFNESPTKVLKREYENLKQDFTKLNAMRYKEFYDSKPLSFILENSELIFSEPYKGLYFYTNIMKEAVLPFTVLPREIAKVTTYLNEHQEKMHEVQKADYQNLLTLMESRYESMKNSICLYSAMMESPESAISIYDDLYECTRTGDTGVPASVIELMESKDINLLDTVNIVLAIPSLYPEMMHYLEACYYEAPALPDEYKLNTYTANVMSRMMKDSYFSERVSHIPNMNLRHFLMGLGGVKTEELVEDILTERVVNFDPLYSSSENSVNRIFEDDLYEELLEDVNDKEKLNRLQCEKAILDVTKSFMVMDALYEGVITPSVNSVVEQICVESTTIEKIPQDISSQLKLLAEKISEVNSELSVVEERYFRSDGSASSVISGSVGKYGQDKMMNRKKEQEEEKPPESTSYTMQKKEEEFSLNPNTSSEKDKEHQDDSDDEEKEADTAIDPDDDDDEEEIAKKKKKAAAEKRRDDKYSNMEINDAEFNALTEGKNDVEKPEKRPFLQRVQNKALDANVKFKKTVAQGRRTAQDARNAGNAVAKIPSNISDSLKKTIDDWEEQDDNRRKQRILEPGYRKKVFNALKLAITHGIAWSINPLLNVVLLITHKGSKMKDERLRNELIRELKAEIAVTKEKIEDARSAGDDESRQAKYKLMRIQEKLEAEVVRVTANSKFV